jgi:hypothetical protein
VAIELTVRQELQRNLAMSYWRSALLLALTSKPSALI